MSDSSTKLELATLAGGCFWCTEAVFQRLKGVMKVTPGYAGGDIPNPSWEKVGNGNTGHAESIQIEFDPTVISFEKILDVFWVVHDPTTLNQQGNDVGTQYRSIIFYHDENQKKTAEASMQKLAASGEYKGSIVTELKPATNFYGAEEYHLNFYDRNKDFPYCRVIIDPKIKKLYKNFKEDLKEE